MKINSFDYLFVYLPGSTCKVSVTRRASENSEGLACLIMVICVSSTESLNRVGETGLVPASSSHTTVRTVRYTAVS